MIRKPFSIMAVVLTALFSISLFASNGTQIGTVGARGTAMGSATRGLADDWSAFFFNPAGLTQLSGTTIGISYGLISPTGTYQPAALPSNPFSGMYTTERDLKEQTFAVPALGFFFKPKEKLTLGIGLMAPFGLGAQFDVFQLPASYGNASSDFSDEYETNSDHEVAFLQPTVAYQLTDKISLGIGVGYTLRGSMVINQVAQPFMEYLEPTTAPLYAVLAGTGVLNPDHKRVLAETNLDGEGDAWTFSAGLHYKITDALSAGVSARFYTPLKLSGTMTTTAYLPGMTPQTQAMYQAGIQGYVQSLVAAGQMTQQEADATAQQLNAGASQAFAGVVSETRYHAEADLPLPATIGLGIAFKPFSKLTLTADASWTNWAAWDTIEVNLQRQEVKTKEYMVEDWENTLEIGVGAEYRLLDGEKFKLDLRAGGYMVPSPAPASTMNPTILDPNSRTALTGGLGLTYGKAMLSVAYEMVMFGEKTVDEYVYDSASGMNENWAGVYNMAANVITFELSVSR